MDFSQTFPKLLGILSIIITLVVYLLFNHLTDPEPLILFTIIGVFTGILALSLELMIAKNKTKGKVVNLTLGVIGILCNTLVGGIIFTYPYFENNFERPLLTYIATHPFTTSGKIKYKTATVKANMQSLATAIESYYIDHCQYPWPDFYENGRPILPHLLTTPVAYYPCGSRNSTAVVLVNDCDIIYDPFNNNGKGILGYGSGHSYSGEGWIITSYGPDTVPGNTGVLGGIPIDPTKAWTDYQWTSPSTGTTFNLQGSGLTYDPTNGINSPGDIWRRGP